MDTSSQKSVVWHTKVLQKKTQQALNYLAKQTWLKKTGWYLAGGTALALQCGHRASVDLGFFTQENNFLPVNIIKHFPENIWTTDILKENTLYGKIMEAKTSFIAYPFFISRQPHKWFDSVRVLDEKDIAVMKIIAVSQRGRKRDFLDLFWYCQNREPLENILRRLPDQYPTVTHDYYHILKSLTYFSDAESDPMPNIFFKAGWSGVKKFFQNEIRIITKKFLRLK